MTEAPVVLRLTDEEVAVLGGTGADTILPVLSQMSPEHRALVLQTAYRSLLARELLELGPQTAARLARGIDSEATELDLDVLLPEGLAELLALRTDALRSVGVGRTTAVGEDACYAYVADEVVLLEEVSVGGMHTFRLVEPTELPGILAGWALAPGAADGYGEPVVIDARAAAGGEASPSDLDRIAAAHLRADVVAREHGASPSALISILSGPQETLLGDLVLGSGAEIRFEPVTLDEVRGRLADLARGERA